ncbi:PEP-CTERM sorting domain-containing protein [Dechloromonas hortensis]|uniref:PEP-CTERM sorting domain-containing protein n=1 Tax=Dechloromonas hortensis TaxID=337779 RepID=UPI0012926EDE|nr:PEP-CTERM sorting domain-containing protein [Dechloromonas hortensis]
MKQKLLVAALSAFFSLGATAAPVIYNNDIVSGQASFDATIAGVGGTVTTLSLSGLSSGSSWSLPGLTISSTNGAFRSIDNDYNSYRASGASYALGGQAIGINPTSPAAGSGLTFTFANPVNAFGLQIGDWATCCTSVTHADTGAPTGSNLFISFDGGATRLVANATSALTNPGNKDYDGDGFVDYVYTNFVAAIDDTSTFTSVTFYGDGFGEYLVAGGTLRYATVAQGSVSNGVSEPETLALVGLGLFGLAASRRRKIA